MLSILLKSAPVIGILRDIPMGAEYDCLRVSKRCGLKAIEVTMNTPNADVIIKKMRSIADPLDILVGAGTVRYLSELETAISAGAQFIVTPTISEEIIKRCVNLQIPIIPGALSPTEIQRAYDLGASFVKVFPVGAMGGASYIRDLRGPFRDIPLMACGGVSEKNAPEYRESGADLLAFGGSIFNPTQMRLGQWDLIEEKLSTFMARACL